MKGFLCTSIIVVLAILITPSASKKSMNLIFERATVTYQNPKYIQNVTVSLTKHNRTSPYIFNYNMKLLQTWGVNVSIALRTFELRDNQYKESIIKSTEHVCHLIEDDKIVTDILWKYSNLPKKCPVRESFTITDYVMVDGTFVPQIPPSKWRFNINLFQNIVKEYILKFEAHVQIKNPVPKKRQ